MGQHIEEPALTDRAHGRQPFDRSRIEPTVRLEHAQPARALGDQHPAIGKEGERPRMFQSAGEHPRHEALALGDLDRQALARGTRAGNGQCDQSCAAQAAPGGRGEGRFRAPGADRIVVVGGHVTSGVQGAPL